MEPEVSSSQKIHNQVEILSVLERVLHIHDEPGFRQELTGVWAEWAVCARSWLSWQSASIWLGPCAFTSSRRASLFSWARSSRPSRILPSRWCSGTGNCSCWSLLINKWVSLALLLLTWSAVVLLLRWKITISHFSLPLPFSIQFIKTKPPHIFWDFQLRRVCESERISLCSFFLCFDSCKISSSSFRIALFKYLCFFWVSYLSLIHLQCENSHADDSILFSNVLAVCLFVRNPSPEIATEASHIENSSLSGNLQMH